MFQVFAIRKLRDTFQWWNRDFLHRETEGRVGAVGQLADQAACTIPLEAEAGSGLGENKGKVLVSHGVRKHCLRQVPPLKARRRKVKYSPFQLSRT